MIPEAATVLLSRSLCFTLDSKCCHLQLSEEIGSLLQYRLSDPSSRICFTTICVVFFCFACQGQCILPAPAKVSLMKHLKTSAPTTSMFWHLHLQFLASHFHSSANKLTTVHQLSQEDLTLSLRLLNLCVFLLLSSLQQVLLLSPIVALF